MAIHQTTDIERYLQLLRDSPREVTLLFRELLIGVTSFFRDPEASGGAEDRVCPELALDPAKRC